MTNFLKTPLGGLMAILAFIAIVAAIVVEQLAGISPASLITDVVLVAGLLGIGGQVNQVKNQTNGTLSKRDATIDDLTDKLNKALALTDAKVGSQVLGIEPDPADSEPSDPTLLNEIPDVPSVGA